MQNFCDHACVQSPDVSYERLSSVQEIAFITVPVVCIPNDMESRRPYEISVDRQSRSYPVSNPSMGIPCDIR